MRTPTRSQRRLAARLADPRQARNLILVLAVTLVTLMLVTVTGLAAQVLSSGQVRAQGNTVAGAIAAAAGLALLVGLTGYLVIHTVVTLAVNQQIRFFGLLKTLGMTPRQLRAVVRSFVLRLALVGLPLGLALGTAVLYAAVPAVIRYLGADLDYAVTPTVLYGYAAAALFALVTLWLSARRPARRAGALPPADAVRHAEQVLARPARPRRALGETAATAQPFSTARLALRRVFGDKRRLALVTASLGVGLATFLGWQTFVASLGVDNYIAEYFPHDFMYYPVTIRVGTADGGMGPEESLIPPDFFDRVRAVPGVTGVTEIPQVSEDGSTWTVYGVDADPGAIDAVDAALRSLNATLAPDDPTEVDPIGHFDRRENARASLQRVKGQLTVVGAAATGVVFLTGLVNFVNVMATEVLVRRRELALLEAAGLPRRRVRRLLTDEGLVYAGLTIATLLTVGHAVMAAFAAVAPRIADYARFHYPWTIMLALIALVLALCAAVPPLAYRASARRPLVDRLKVAA
jgi:ABC-type lipoprotein release transport system permease subunit